jgi:Spy/CpxP family protein refolding chaperone
MVNARAKGYVVLAAVFALGAAAGGAGVHAYDARRHAAAFGEGGRRAFDARRMHALSRKLDLDATQEQQIGAIFESEHDEMRTLSRDVMDKCGQPLRDHKAKIDAQIRAVLRPDQQKRFDDLVEERREHMWLGPTP